MLLNVGSGGGAAAAPTGGAGGSAPADTPAEAAKEDQKEEGKPFVWVHPWILDVLTSMSYREGGVGRRHGFRSLWLDSAFDSSHHQACPLHQSKHEHNWPHPQYFMKVTIQLPNSQNLAMQSMSCRTFFRCFLCGTCSWRKEVQST